MMQPPVHSIGSLFLQLGLDYNELEIEAFISEHSPLAHDVLLHEAGFWNASQAAFLKQAVAEDADWAIVVDQLDSMLR
jgi:hypothetical protein